MFHRVVRHTALRQLVKFCIVGATSTIVDKGALWLLLFHLLPQAPLQVNQSLSFCLGVTNGFIWNRLWTFKQGAGDFKRQYPVFVATNIIGLALNLLITQGFILLLTRNAPTSPDNLKQLQFLASLCAIPIVVVWNFTAAKLFTFRAPKNVPGLAGSPSSDTV